MMKMMKGGNMQRMMRGALEMPAAVLRNGGIAAVLFGFAIVWLIRR